MSRDREHLIYQSPHPVTLPPLSLEGMPVEIKLHILFALRDLPSLRCLRSASSEYYLTSRAYPRSLHAKFKNTYTPSTWSLRFDNALLQGKSHHVTSSAAFSSLLTCKRSRKRVVHPLQSPPTLPPHLDHTWALRSPIDTPRLDDRAHLLSHRRVGKRCPRGTTFP